MFYYYSLIFAHKSNKNNKVDINCYKIFCDKNINYSEYTDLMIAVNWGSKDDYKYELFKQTINNYPFIAYARDLSGKLIAYLSAFSDKAFSTFIGEIVVMPQYQKIGIAKDLLEFLIQNYSDAPIYCQVDAINEEIFAKLGFKNNNFVSLYKKRKLV